MKHFNTLSATEKLSVIYSNEEIRRDFRQYLIDSEYDLLSNIMEIFEDTCYYNFGIYEKGYVRLRATYGDIRIWTACDFLIDMGTYINNYGGSNELNKAYEHAKKLKGTNLFIHQCQKLCDIFYSSEIQGEIEALEDMDYLISESKTNDYIEDTADCYTRCDLFVDGKKVYKKLN